MLADSEAGMHWSGFVGLPDRGAELLPFHELGFKEQRMTSFLFCWWSSAKQ